MRFVYRQKRRGEKGQPWCRPRWRRKDEWGWFWITDISRGWEHRKRRRERAEDGMRRCWRRDQRVGRGTELKAFLKSIERCRDRG